MAVKKPIVANCDTNTTCEYPSHYKRHSLIIYPINKFMTFTGLSNTVSNFTI